ncbi:MAG TPA: hypothetical protein VFU05_09155 [Cyclobacteriaceae bacterium]|nr:hypothetical protein [Cyclobacteriaceae bacterium]
MINRLFVLVLLIGIAGTVSAQYNTGDAKLDASLAKIDEDAKRDGDGINILKGVSKDYNVPESKVDTWSKQGMKPGDIVMACEVGKITKKPVDDVVKAYQANKEKGWGAISKELGIKPGSPEFHALKKNADEKANKSKSKKASPKKKDQKAKAN